MALMSFVKRRDTMLIYLSDKYGIKYVQWILTHLIGKLLLEVSLDVLSKIRTLIQYYIDFIMF